jgi:alpha-amylase
LKSVGYDIYDVYDLGEFDQKAGVRTKYGTKDELLELAKTAKEHDVVIYVDTVLNHKFGADERERFKVKEVSNDDRTKAITGLYDIEVGMFYSTPGVCLTYLIGLDQVYLPEEEQ